MHQQKEKGSKDHELRTRGRGDTGFRRGQSRPAPDHKSYGSFISFEDPDGNGWLVQEITTRLPGR
jgi:hypothetical protein